MANLITHSLTFEKESLTEFFLKPLFIGSDIRDMVTVRTDIQGTEKLDFITKLRKITKAYATGSSFTPSTGVTVTQKNLIVTLMKAQVNQSGSAFFGWVKEAALKKGFAWDNIDGTIFQQIVGELFAKAVAEDLQRQAFFGDLLKEKFVSGIPSHPDTATTLDLDYSEYDGFWTRVIRDMPSSNRVTVVNGAVAQEQTETLSSITAGTITLTVNGQTLSQAFATSADVTAANWVTTHAAALAARNQPIVVTDTGTGEITFVSGVPGLAMSIVETSAGTGGSWANVVTVANVLPADLATDEGVSILTSLWKLAPNELIEFGVRGMRYMVTRSVMENYMETLEELNGSDEAHRTMLNGTSVLTYRGVPIVVRPEWDTHIDADFGGVFPHRAILTVPENFVLGTDLNGADNLVEMFYDQTEQENIMRAQYKAGTQIIHELELLVAAF